MTTSSTNLPIHLTEESAIAALDGPADQRVAVLRAIIAACKNHEETDAAAALIDEAEEYLRDLTA